MMYRMRNQRRYMKRTLSALGLACVMAMVGTSCQHGEQPNPKEVQQLSQRLDSIMGEYNKLHSEADLQGNADVARKDSLIAAQSAEIKQLLARLQKAQAVQSGEEQGVDKQTLKRQQKELQARENEIKQLKKELAKQEAELKRLMDQAAAGNETPDQSSKVVALQKQLDSQREEIARLSEQLKSARQQESSSSTALNQCKEESRTLNSRITELNHRVAELTKQVESSSAGVATDVSKSTQLQAETEKAQQQLATVTKQYEQCNASLGKLQQEMDKLSNKVAEQTKKENEYKQQIASLEEQVRQLSATSEAQSSNQKSQAAAAAELAALRSQIEELSKKEAACSKERITLQEQCQTKEQQLQRTIDELNGKVSQLNGRVAELEKLFSAATDNSFNEEKAKAESKRTQELNELRVQLEQQQRETQRLQALVESREAELAQLKNSASAPATTSTAAVNQKLTELQALCNDYAAEIERLRSENASLKAENSVLRETKTSADKVLSENAALLKKVEMASVLVTAEMQAATGKSIQGSTLKATTKAKSTNVIRINAKVLDNHVIDPGTVSIYARVANAANRIVCNGDPTSQTFDMGGIPMQYTLKQDIEFTGYSRNIQMVWKRADETELQPGLYWVTLYANGYEIGKTSFKLD